MLTDTKCKASAPREKLYRLANGGGLYLEVKPNGVKAWRYRFEIKGKESLFAIGEYAPASNKETAAQAEERRAAKRFTLQEARAERTRCRDLVRQGINPADHRKQEQIKAEHAARITFEVIAKEWLSMRDWHELTKQRRLDVFERVIFPKIGQLPIAQITSLQVLDVLNDADKKNGPSVRDVAKRSMSSVFELAIATLRAETDPVYPVRKAHPRNKTQHKRALEEGEIAQLLRDFKGLGGRYETVASFQLMWWTLCRPNEVVEAQWQEFDLGAACWLIPAGRMKMGKAHKVPLPSQAVEMLKVMRGLTGRFQYVFPGRDKRTVSMSQASWRQALMKLGWSGRFSPHATRVTGSTRLHEMGYRSEWIERQLAHADTNAVRATYNHALYYEDRAQMMQKWADHLEKLSALES